MLRVSVSQSSLQVDLSSLRTGDSQALDAIPNARTLIRLADAFIDREPGHLANIREKATSVIGELAVIEAIGVAANFLRMVRIASGTGIPIDETDLEFGKTVRAALNLSDVARHPLGEKIAGRQSN